MIQKVTKLITSCGLITSPPALITLSCPTVKHRNTAYMRGEHALCLEHIFHMHFPTTCSTAVKFNKEDHAIGARQKFWHIFTYYLITTLYASTSQVLRSSH